MPSYMMSYEYEIIYIGHDTCFCGSAAYILACGMYRLGIGISSCLGRLLPNGAQVVQCSVHPSRRAPPASLAPRNHGLSCRLEPFAASNATTTATGRIGRVCDSITRRGEGMGSLKRERAAQQWQRFRQGSIPGDAGGPLALDTLPSLEHSTDPAR